MKDNIDAVLFYIVGKFLPKMYECYTVRIFHLAWNLPVFFISSLQYYFISKLFRLVILSLLNSTTSASNSKYVLSYGFITIVVSLSYSLII